MQVDSVGQLKPESIIIDCRSKWILYSGLVFVLVGAFSIHFPWTSAFRTMECHGRSSIYCLILKSMPYPVSEFLVMAFGISFVAWAGIIVNRYYLAMFKIVIDEESIAFVKDWLWVGMKWNDVKIDYSIISNQETLEFKDQIGLDTIVLRNFQMPEKAWKQLVEICREKGVLKDSTKRQFDQRKKLKER